MTTPAKWFWQRDLVPPLNRFYCCQLSVGISCVYLKMTSPSPTEHIFFVQFVLKHHLIIRLVTTTSTQWTTLFNICIRGKQIQNLARITQHVNYSEENEDIYYNPRSLWNITFGPRCRRFLKLVHGKGPLLKFWSLWNYDFTNISWTENATDEQMSERTNCKRELTAIIKCRKMSYLVHELHRETCRNSWN